jgi:PPOX class probable F420-dependent enzyme
MNNWKNANYLNLSTQKRDGSWVNTPVWFAFADGSFFLFSEGKAGKVKRIRNFSSVSICPCTVTGKLTGNWQSADATLLQTPAETKTAYQALLQKYGWQLRLLDAGAILARKKHKRAFIKITLKN